MHSQGVVHRDIKPDNLLLNEDDVLKIVDFGVSEMFEQSTDMKTAKSAGSPAFLPPELCVAKHGDVSGKAADIWSMGVSLYCLRYGKIPFEKFGVLDMYEAIRTEAPFIPEGENPLFVDLMGRLMEKDPEKRITMEELRVCLPPFFFFFLFFLFFCKKKFPLKANKIEPPLGHQKQLRPPPPHR